jgi:hypothetical protein
MTLLVLSCTSRSFFFFLHSPLLPPLPFPYFYPTLRDSFPSLSPSPFLAPSSVGLDRMRSQVLTARTLSRFHGEDIYVSSLFHGVGIFLFSFAGSMFLGVAFGLCCSLGLKHSHLASYPHIESCIVALVAYTSYFFSNGLSMSGESIPSLSSPTFSSRHLVQEKGLMAGIVSLLFCGITLKHYAYHTMSRRTQKTTKYMFAVLAQLSENFIFIYLGLNLFTQDVQVFKPLFILVSAVSPPSKLPLILHILTVHPSSVS